MSSTISGVFPRAAAAFALVAAVFIFTVPGARTGAAAKYDVRRLPAVWQYIDCEDDAYAGKMAEKLLKKHKGEKKAAKLVKSFKRGRPFIPGLPKQETVKRTCADGIEREFTYYVPSKYTPRKKYGVLIWLHGAIGQSAPGGGAHEARDIGGAIDELEYIKIGPSTFGGHE